MTSNISLHTKQCSHVALYKNRDNSLKIGEYVTTVDEQAEEALCELAREMKDWDLDTAQMLKREMRQIDNRCCVGWHEPSLYEILNRYLDDVRRVLSFMNSESGQVGTQNTLHGWWTDRSSISYMMSYAKSIEDFSIERQTVLSAIDDLESEQPTDILSIYDEAVALQSLLKPVLAEYRKRFEDYVDQAESLIPGIFERKDYCRSFTGSYGTGELDYYITLGNQTIVNCVEEYIRAYELENAYIEFEDADNSLLMANRYLGRHEYGIDIDKGCELSVLLRTNFGFGRSSYFNAILKYKGVSAINVYSIIFYRVAGMAQVSGSTFEYEVEEKSFSTCFKNIRDLGKEYLKIGETLFVDKYFKQSLKDLSELLYVIAATNTFLQVTTLERLESLTGNTTCQLIPVDSFDEVSFELSTVDEEDICKLSERILVYLDNGESLSKGEDEAIDEIVNRLSESPHSNNVLQQIVRLDLIRSKLIANLGQQYDRPNHIVSVINGLLPQKDGLQAEAYEGYDLIDYRAWTVSRVLSLIDRITEIAKLVDFEEILEDIYSASLIVCKQAVDYKSDEIAPRLEAITAEEADLQEQLASLLEQKKSLEEMGTDAKEAETGIEELRERMSPISAKKALLEARAARLESFIESVTAISESQSVA